MQGREGRRRVNDRAPNDPSRHDSFALSLTTLAYMERRPYMLQNTELKGVVPMLLRSGEGSSLDSKMEEWMARIRKLLWMNGNLTSTTQCMPGTADIFYMGNGLALWWDTGTVQVRGIGREVTWDVWMRPEAIILTTLTIVKIYMKPQI